MVNATCQHKRYKYLQFNIILHWCAKSKAGFYHFPASSEILNKQTEPGLIPPWLPPFFQSVTTSFSVPRSYSIVDDQFSCFLKSLSGSRLTESPAFNP